MNRRVERGNHTGLWAETHEPDGSPRVVYRSLMERMTALRLGRRRELGDRLEATMREMGVTFDIARDKPWGKRPWICDVLPQIFEAAEWKVIEHGMVQRLRAFEMFLADIYGPREILRSGEVPIQPVLGSGYYQRPAAGIDAPGGAFLHLSGLAVCRMPDGGLVVKHHYFSNASGISYMMQNRRALARVLPTVFADFAIHSIAEASTDVLEMLRSLSQTPEPTVVLLSAGPGSAVYSEHSFLARRMGIPLVQGSDLLVVNDAVFLKTVSGLEQVEVIYSRLADDWLDPLAFRRDSLLGVPGLVHCIRKGTVALVNAIGSQVADDRAILPFASSIIRFYLGERPILKGLPTYWLGDIDQREMVLSELGQFTIRPLYGERIVLGGAGRPPEEEEVAAARDEILANPSRFIAQPDDCDAMALCFDEGKPVMRRQDHILFAVRRGGGDYHVIPGALTRISTAETPYTASELGGGSKDTWVEVSGDAPPQLADRSRVAEPLLPSQHVTSRVAEAFYWIGRYLERAQNLATMVSVIEALELEELNPTERTLYRPVWNRILPPLENPDAVSRRNISSPAGRCRLTLDLDETDSVVRTILRAAANAESILECLSVEAWSVLDGLRTALRKIRFRPQGRESEMTIATRKACELAVNAVPQFFGTAERTMIADGGWAFCEIGQYLERAIITANAAASILRPMPGGDLRIGVEHVTEIRLSAFLRLLNSRDVYRRVYQMRIEPGPMMELLWRNPVAPRSVTRCLTLCRDRLAVEYASVSAATERTLGGIESLLEAIRQTPWDALPEVPPTSKNDLSARLLDGILEIHHLIADGFLTHQAPMRPEMQTLLFGLKDAFRDRASH